VNYSDDQLIAETHQWLPHAEQHIAAVQVLHERESMSKRRAELRSEESLSISRKALRNSDRAIIIAISAIVLSIIMAIQKIIEWYSL
jgi:hypothetical protein